MDEYTRLYYNKGYRVIAGIDEAGRGPLAGPVFASVVILPKKHSIVGLADSKKLTAKKREDLFKQIIEKAIDYSVASSDEVEIDEINILQATFLAMKRALKKLKVKPEIVLVDGSRDPNFDIPTVCIIKGDNLVESISAASILAKVSRDRFITTLSEQYPQYGLDKHKGYGTKMHYEAIKKYGISKIHRKTFLKNLIGKEY